MLKRKKAWSLIFIPNPQRGTSKGGRAVGPPHERAPANPKEGDLPEAAFASLSARLR